MKRHTDDMTRANTLHPLSTVDLTHNLSSLICQICLLVSFIVSLCSLPSNRSVLSRFLSPSIPQPPACSLHSQSPSLSLTFCSLTCPCSPSTFLPSLPFPSSFLLLLLLLLCSRLALTPPCSHTQAASSPHHFYLHTHLFAPPSHCSSRLLPSHHLLTHIISGISFPSVASLSFHSFLHLFHSSLQLSHTQPCCLTRIHTHADWHPRTEHSLSQTGDQAICSCGQAS